MKERFRRFMIGRNGNDQLNSFLLIVAVVLLLISPLFSALGNAVHSIVRTFAFAIVVVIYFRMFSKDIYKRQEENGKYLRARYKVFAKLKALKERWVQRKDYKFFYCSSCHAVLRVPRGRGKIKIVCRKCGNTFTGKS